MISVHSNAKSAKQLLAECTEDIHSIYESFFYITFLYHVILLLLITMQCSVASVCMSLYSFDRNFKQGELEIMDDGLHTCTCTYTCTCRYMYMYMYMYAYACNTCS